MEEILLNIPQIQFPHMGIYGEMKKKPTKPTKTQLAEMHMSSEVLGCMNCLLELCPMSILRKIKNGK